MHLNRINFWKQQALSVLLMTFIATCGSVTIQHHAEAG